MQNRTPNSQIDKIFTVSELNKEVSTLLEASYPKVLLEGEISNLVKHGSGHWYFSLKDDNAQVSCAMFKMNNRRVKMIVDSGIKVTVTAKVSLYAPRGNYQLIVQSMEPAGIGNLQQAFDALKLKLFNEGLFDKKHKLSIPALPKKIAVITSPTGAAVRDIIKTCHRRFPLVPIDIYPCIVQGTQAAASINGALKNALNHQQADVIIIARGGGSMEDLWAFNDESLARTIFTANIPIISGIGHEIDTTIVDYVADYHAPTPTGAAEIATPDSDIVFEKLTRLKRQLEKEMNLTLRTLTQRVDILAQKCSAQSPKIRLNHLLDQSKQHEKQIKAIHHRNLHAKKQYQAQLSHRLFRAIKQTNFSQLQRQVGQSSYHLHALMQQHLTTVSNRLTQTQKLLITLGPQQVLKRGYVYITDFDGNVIKKRRDLSKQGSALAHFNDGNISIQTKD